MKDWELWLAGAAIGLAAYAIYKESAPVTQNAGANLLTGAENQLESQAGSFFSGLLNDLGSFGDDISGDGVDD